MSNLMLLMVAAVSICFVDLVTSASVLPNERYYATSGSCNLDTPADDSVGTYACFTCINIPNLTTTTTNTPTAAPTSNDYPAKSRYTHCFLDKDSVYTIFYEESDCKGKVTYDLLDDGTCPDCTGCSSSADCGTNNCPLECCGALPECGRCHDIGYCKLYESECNDCPNCGRPNSICDILCGDPGKCASNGPACLDCPVCSLGRRLSDQVDELHIDITKNELMERDIRILADETGQNFSSKARVGVPVQDSNRLLAIATIFLNETCSSESSIASSPLSINQCHEIPEEADNETLAILINCSDVDPVESTVTGFASMQDCLNNEPTHTFSHAVKEGECISASSKKWGISVKCSGWGKPPTPSPPPLSGPDDIALGTLFRYPDRRCEPGTGVQSEKNYMPCDICFPNPNGGFLKVDCTTGEANSFTDSNCNNFYRIEYSSKCKGRGPIRGIHNFEKIYKPRNSVAFISLHVGSTGCFAKNVQTYIGVEQGLCLPASPIPSFGLVSFYVKVECETRNIIISGFPGCSIESNVLVNTTFTDGECLSVLGGVGWMSVSCNGFISPQTQSPTNTPTTSTPTNNPTPPTLSPTISPTPPTFSPSTSPTLSPTPPTKTPTHSPTKGPTNPTPLPSLSPTKATQTVSPSKNPTTSKAPTITKSPTEASHAISKFQVSHTMQALISVGIGLAALVIHP